MQQARLIQCGAWRKTQKCAALDEEADLERPIVTPEAHALPSWVIAPATVWKTKGHGLKTLFASMVFVHV